MEKYLDSCVIKRRLSVPHTPQQNGRAERINRTLLEMARCMLIGAQLDTSFWQDAVAAAAYIQNRTPKRSLHGKTPYEISSGSRPDISNLRIFGCKAVAHVNESQRYKAEGTGKECIMLGYARQHKAYLLWDIRARKQIVACDVQFFEESSMSPTQSVKKAPASTTRMQHQGESNVLTFDMLGVDSGDEQHEEQKMEVDEVFEKHNQSILDVEAMDICSSDEQQQTLVTGTRKSLRKSNPPLRFEGFELTSKRTRKDYSTTPIPAKNKRQKTDNLEPKNYESAISSEEASLWIQAMDNEMDAIIRNCTWELASLPPGANVVSTKWVFKKKVEQNNEVRYKSRLVARGFNQQPGVDFDETYSPVVSHITIRLLFAYAVRNDLEIRHLDVESAFLQGDLEEDVYVEQPEGYVDPRHPNKVCKLLKAIYGLKQSGRVWNKKLDQILKDFGLQRSNFDQCVYFIEHKDNTILIVSVTVDDLAVFASNKALIDQLVDFLKQRLPIKDLGDIKKFLNVNITRDRQRGILYMDQEDKITNILAQYNMQDCHPSNTPMDPNSTLTTDLSPKSAQQLEKLSKIPYQNAVGSLMYLVQMTRPDLAYVISKLSQFNTSYNDSHWQALKRVLRYLKGTKHYKLCFTRDPNGQLQAYCDSTWVCDLNDGKSVSGYIFTFQNGPISWHSKKQPSVATSSTVAEYQALSTATMEAIWLRNFAEELGIQKDTPLQIHCDNKGAVDLARNANFSRSTRHVCAKHKFIQEQVNSKAITVIQVSTEDMLADPLTKAVPAPKMQDFVARIGLV